MSASDSLFGNATEPVGAHQFLNQGQLNEAPELHYHVLIDCGALQAIHRPIPFLNQVL